MNLYNYLFKFITVGDSDVGKSCLLLQFTDKRFRNQHEPTIGVEFGARNILVNDNQIKLQIWDASGLEAFRSITRSYYTRSIGGILVFDVTSRQSFDNLQLWEKEIQSYTCKEITIVIVGNKVDLNDKREVSKEEAQNYATKQGFSYFETSAKNNENISSIYESMTKTILDNIENGIIDPTNDVILIAYQIYGIKIGSIKKQIEKKIEYPVVLGLESQDVQQVDHKLSQNIDVNKPDNPEPSAFIQDIENMISKFQKMAQEIDMTQADLDQKVSYKENQMNQFKQAVIDQLTKIDNENL